VLVATEGPRDARRSYMSLEGCVRLIPGRLITIVPDKLYFLASRTTGLSIFSVQQRQGTEISASTSTDHFIPTSLQMTFSTVGLQDGVMLQPNSIKLPGSKLVGDQLRTSFEPASVMEFGFYNANHNATKLHVAS